MPSPITAGDAQPGTKYTTRGQELVTAGALVEDAGVRYRRVTTQLGVHSDLPLDYPLYPLDAASGRVGALVGLPEAELRPQLAQLSAEELDELADQDGRTWVLDAVAELQGVDLTTGQVKALDAALGDVAAKLDADAPPDDQEDAGAVCAFTGLPERVMQGALAVARTGDLWADTADQDDDPGDVEVIGYPPAPTGDTWDTDPLPDADGTPQLADDLQAAAGAALVELDQLDAVDTNHDGGGAEMVALPRPTRPAPAQAQATGQDQAQPPPLPAGMGLCSVCGSQDRIKPKVGDEQVLVLVAHSSPTARYCMGSGRPPQRVGRARPEPEDPAKVWNGATTADDRLAIVKACSTAEEVDRLRLAPSPTPALQAAVRREYDRQLQALDRVTEALQLDGAAAQVERLRDMLSQSRTTARPGLVAACRRELLRLEQELDPRLATGEALDRLLQATGLPDRLPGEDDAALRDRLLANLRPVGGTPVELEAALEAALAEAGMSHNVTIVMGQRPGEVDVLVVGGDLAALDLVTDRLADLAPAGTRAIVRSDLEVTRNGVGVEDDPRPPITELVQPPTTPRAEPPPWDLGAKPWPERVAMSSRAAALELIREQQEPDLLRDAWVAITQADGETVLLEACEEQWEALTGNSWDTDPVVPSRRHGPGQPLPPTPAPDPDPDPDDQEPQRRRCGPTYRATLELDVGDAEARAAALRDTLEAAAEAGQRAQASKADPARLAAKAQALQQLQTYLQQWPVQALAAQSLGIRMEIRLDNTPPTDLD